MTEYVSASMKIAGAKAAEAFGVILSFEQTAAIYAAMLAASPQGEGSSADADTHRGEEGAAVARERDEAVRLLRRIVETKAEDYDERLEAGYIQAFLVSLSRPATTPAEPDWITHDGGPNPVPGATEAFDALDLADRLIERAYGGDTPSEWNVAYRGVANARRVTEGVKP